MNNFVYHSPTKVYFGQGYESQIGALLKEHGFRKPLMVYGGGSIKRSGLYDTVTASLKDAGLTWAELPGVQPNPLLGLAKQGIALFRAEQCDVLLAVGGGSAIDTAKVIGLGVPYDGDVWDFWCGKADPKTGIPTVAILTIAAAGSETSESAVIDWGISRMRLMATTIFIGSVGEIYVSGLRGTGNSVFPMLMSVLCRIGVSM